MLRLIKGKGGLFSPFFISLYFMLNGEMETGTFCSQLLRDIFFSLTFRFSQGVFLAQFVQSAKHPTREKDEKTCVFTAQTIFNVA